MSTYCLKILGPPSIESEKGDVTLSRHKSIGILAYLTSTERKVSRNELASLFWPDSNLSKSLGALRTSLTEINSALCPQVFNQVKDYIQVDRSILACDVHKFRDKRRGEDSLNEMMEAVELWNGGFLKGFELKGTPVFTDWQYLEEQNLEQEYAGLLRRISTLLAENGREREALVYRRKLQSLDPYDEDNHREIMILHVRMGDRKSALQQLKICRRYLEEDLGFPLEEKTAKLAGDIRDGRIPAKADDNPPKLEKKLVKLPRLAILPLIFEEKEKGDQPDFSHIVSEVMTDFSSLQREIEVISRTSTLAYRDSGKNLPRIASELRADYMIEGEIEDRGDRLHIKTRLIDAARDSVIASKQLESQTEGGSAAGSARIIAAALLKELEINVDDHRDEKDDPGLPWRLHGHSLLKESSPDLEEQAIRAFMRALELNPKDAEAWAGIGLTKIDVCNAGFLGIDTEKYYREAQEAADKALAMDPGEPMALFVKGCIAEDRDWDYDRAENLYGRALLTDPGNSSFLQGCSTIMVKKKRLDEAIEMAERAYELNPVCMWSISTKYWALVAARQYRKASLLDMEVHTFFPHESWDGFNSALTQLYLKNYEKAASVMEKVHDLLIEENMETLLFAQAYAYGGEGKREKAEEIISLMTENRENMTGFSIPLAAVYTVLKDYDKALNLIESAIDNRDPTVFFLIHYPFYDPLYAFPRFGELMRRAGFDAWL